MVDRSRYWPKKQDHSADVDLPKGVFRKGLQLYHVTQDAQTKRQIWTKLGPTWNGTAQGKWRASILRHNSAGHVKRTLYVDDTGPVALPALKDLLANARKNARARGLEITITLDDILALAELSQGRCMLTGISFEHGAATSLADISSRRKRVWAPSLDRIESSKGYVPGNVRLVCMAVNAALQEFGDAVLLRIAKALVERHGISNIQ
ncbi:hypothetical protein KIH07_17000 [Hydrogenophaga taeniospiralis]|uniref:hypothetical protein n=1 Tax=Hydrogenophaga taeniospiralis TaxID=65656 RepID=UPI001CFC2279|nr:hypothetical protein [Hydrogenophaga taeniospiralis]MCB4365444.1 hypothetical protein [Hydrogenophaga taeniospiralis]